MTDSNVEARTAETASKEANARTLTKMEYAAIHLRVEHKDCPDWLNEMIREANRAELVKAILPSLQNTGFDWAARRTELAFEFADQMIAEGKK